LVVRNNRKLCSSGREVVLQGSAKLQRRRIKITRSQGSSLAGRRVSQKDVCSSAVFPFGPVTIEKRFCSVRLERPLRPGIGDLLVASVVAAAFGIHVRRERDPLAVGGP